MQLTFRLAQPDDLDILMVFRRALCAEDPVPFDEAPVRVALVTLMREPAFGRVWLMLDGDEAIGYVALCLGYSLEFYGREAIVDELYVVASHRGRGVGRRALALVEDEARALGVRALHLVVERGNAPAQALYRRVGYRAHDRDLMTKWLAAPAPEAV